MAMDLEHNTENALRTLDLRIEPGQPHPLGATLSGKGVNFAIYSRQASAVSLVLCDPVTGEWLAEFGFDEHNHRTGDVWHLFVAGLSGDVGYCYRITSSADPGRPDTGAPGSVLLDPYARRIAGRHYWGRPVDSSAKQPEVDGVRWGVVGDHTFDWENDQHPRTSLADSVIYEVHVRGFTRHESAATAHPGTFAGLMGKMPYLVELGVTAVELLPVTEFEEAENERIDPGTGNRLLNYWGYHPISTFSPKSSFAASGGKLGQVQEFKRMVKALHAAGIEVILDMVFNHTGEGDEFGTSYSFRGIDRQTYYLTDQVTGLQANLSGCGNTLNCNHPVVQNLILDCLRYWVREMRVDGFRFDLATILCRGEDGEVMLEPPLVNAIAEAPILAHTKLIAEPWDAAGGYQVGKFPAPGRWAEWNGKFRDDVRRFVRGDRGMVRPLADRLAGSPDVYSHSDHRPFNSINFVSCHDGFTLGDLCSFEYKQNQANGESDRDGSDHNLSWNCGAEGRTDDARINQLR